MPRKHNIPLPKNVKHLNKFVKTHSARITAPMDVIVRVTDSVGDGTVKGVVQSVGPAVTQLSEGEEVVIPYAGVPGRTHVMVTLL